MKMWSLNVMILLLFCYACLSTGKGKVFFISKNFFNVLHWDAAEPEFPGQVVLYSVHIQRHGENQYEIQWCQNITTTTCNLTAETPSLHDVQYVAQVSVGGASLGYTTRFKSLAETTFSPPILSKTTTESKLSMNVTLPLGPRGESIAEIVARSMEGSSQNVFVYSLSVTHPEWAAQIIENMNGQFVMDLKTQTQYCGYVVYRPSSEWGRKESEQADFCVTPSDDLNLHWILVGAAALVALVTVSVVLMCTYVKGGKPKSMPHALAPSTAPGRVLESPDRNLFISKIAVCTQSEKTTYATIIVKPTVPSTASEGYSPQDVQDCQARTGSSVGTGAGGASPNPDNTSGQSSNIYGAVSVHVPDKEEEEDEEDSLQAGAGEDKETSHPLLFSDGTNWTSGEISLIPRGAPSLPGEDSPVKPLVLQTLRNVNGQLTLPSFSLQLQSSIDDTASSTGPERKHLLSDFTDSKDRPSLASLQCFDSSEWSDSGCDDSTLNTLTQGYCNTSYFSPPPESGYLQQGTQSVTSSCDASGYKPNWMPSGDYESESVENCEYRANSPSAWTGVNMEEEGTASPTQIILGN